MSTRCQVQVIQEGLSWEEKLTLYHHTDGYPEYIIPLIRKAYDLAIAPDSSWRAGRAGKVASFLCAADPGIFEPEEGHELRGDIQFYYRVYCINIKSFEEQPIIWEVEIFEVGIEGKLNNIQSRKDILTLTTAERLR